MMKNYILTGLLITLYITVFAQNKALTFVFLNNKPDKEVLSKEKSDSIMQGHMNNIDRLAKEGKLLAAGPFEGGGGLFVLNTSSTKEANEWLETDPGVKAKRWNLEVLPYSVRNGSICPVGEKYEMVFYQCVRFSTENTLKNRSQHMDSFVQRFFKDDLLIHAGVFTGSDSGIMILKTEVSEETVKGDAALKSGDIRFEMKKLYIAKGSFCEK